MIVEETGIPYMSLRKYTSENLHHKFKLESLPVSVGGLLLLIVSVSALSFSTPLSAGSRMQNPDASAVIDLPVVRPDKTRATSHQGFSQGINPYSPGL